MSRRPSRSPSVADPAPSSSPADPRSTRAGTSLLLAFALVALSFAAYWPALGAGFVWDDDAYLTRNPHLHDLAGLRDVWLRIGATKMYVPLVFTTFWIEHHLWGLEPLGYHAVNIALHGLGAILFWLLLRRLDVGGAWLAAALFAVHPVFVESVVWITELKNTLSTVLALLALLAFFRSRPIDSEGATGRRWWFFGLAIVAFAGALLAKPVVVGLPLAILVLVWWKRGRIGISDVAAVVPMLLLSLAAGLLAIYVERNFGGARGLAWQIPLTERLLVAGRAFWFYLGKLVWPVGLLPIYPRWQVSVTAWWQYLYPLAALGAAALLWIGRSKWGRGPAAGGAVFALLVAPLVGIFNVSYHLHSFVADHFQHHAAPALLALFGAAAMRLHGATELRHRWLVPVSSGACLALLAVLTWRYVPAFASEEARCRAILEGNPASWVAMNNLGAALNARQAHAEAIPWLERAIAAHPPYPEAQNNLGVALVGLGRPEDAIPHYREALRVFPDSALAHNNLGTALARLGQVEAAIAEYREALRFAPDYAEARDNLALLTTSAEARNRAGKALAGEGRLPQAIQEFRAAVAMRPDDSDLHNDLGTALMSSGDLAGALREYYEAVRLAPENVGARANLGRALLAAERASEAVEHLRFAAQKKPGDAEAQGALGVALAQTGRFEEAVAAFERAVALDPANPEARRDLDRARSLAKSSRNPA